MKKLNKYQLKILQQYRETNRVAFYHPRLETISLNGGRELPITEAIKQMRECLTI